MNIKWVTWKELQRLKKYANGYDMFYQYFLCNKNDSDFFYLLSDEYKEAIANDTFVSMPLPQFGRSLTANDFADDNPCWGYRRENEDVMVDARFYPLIPQEV